MLCSPAGNVSPLEASAATFDEIGRDLSLFRSHDFARALLPLISPALRITRSLSLASLPAPISEDDDGDFFSFNKPGTAIRCVRNAHDLNDFSQLESSFLAEGHKDEGTDGRTLS